MRQNSRPFAAQERDVIYRALTERRSVRGDISRRAVPSRILARVLDAASHAPTVGNSQPFEILHITDSDVRSQLQLEVSDGHSRTLESLPLSQATRLCSLKLPLEVSLAPILLAFCSQKILNRRGVFGAATVPHTELISLGCAIENIWIAARAEGLALRLVTTFRPARLKRILNLSKSSVPIALACLGYCENFDKHSEFERMGIGRKQSRIQSRMIRGGGVLSRR